MYRKGTDPNTGYLVFVFEPGDIEEGMTIVTRDGYRSRVKRTGKNHILCESWPADIKIRYEEIKDAYLPT